MNMPITIYNSAGTDRTGKQTFGSGTATKCRFRQTNGTITTATNEIEPVDGVVITKATETINIGDKIAYNSLNYKVLTKLVSIGANGNPHHFELKVQEYNQ